MKKNDSPLFSFSPPLTFASSKSTLFISNNQFEQFGEDIEVDRILGKIPDQDSTIHVSELKEFIREFSSKYRTVNINSIVDEYEVSILSLSYLDLFMDAVNASSLVYNHHDSCKSNYSFFCCIKSNNSSFKSLDRVEHPSSYRFYCQTNPYCVRNGKSSHIEILCLRLRSFLLP